MSGGVIFRQAVSVLGQVELPEIARREVLATLEAGRPGPLQFLWEAAAEAGLSRQQTLERGAAIYINHCAGNVADDLADGDCTYLEEPIKAGPVAQFILQNLFFGLLARAGLPGPLIEAVALDMVEGAGPQHVEVRTQSWTAAATRLVAEGIAGRQYAAYMRILWHGTRLEKCAPEIGQRIGEAVHVAIDLRTDDPRVTTLSTADRREVLAWARASAAALRREKLGCLEGILDDIEPVLDADR